MASGGGLVRASEALRLPLGPVAAVVALGVLAQVVGGIWPVAAGLALFLGGVVHGAAEETSEGLRPYSLPRALAYVVAALAIAAAYVAAPLPTLIAFLALSAWHFAREGEDRATFASTAVALLAIGGSALFRETETAAVFARITGERLPDLAMQPLAVAGVGGVLLTALSVLRRGARASAPVLALAATALLHPVLAVGAIFFALHALPMHARLARLYGSRETMAALLPTAIPALLGALALIVLAWTAHIALPLAAALALGFATPHMLAERTG